MRPLAKPLALFALATSAACASPPPPLDATPLGPKLYDQGHEYLDIEVKTAPGALVTCEPKCGGGAEADEKGVAKVHAPLAPERGKQSFVLHAKARGLSGGVTTRTVEYDHQPYVLVDRETGEVTEVACGVETCSGKIEWGDGALLTLHAPNGTKVELGQARGETWGASGSAMVRAYPDPPPEAADLALGDGADTSTTKASLPLRVIFADGTVVETKVTGEMRTRAIASAALAGVQTRPLLFPGEDTKPRATRAILWIDDQKRTFIGSASRVSDVDLVAFQTFTKRTLDCGNYYGSSGAVRVTAQIIDEDVVLVDRRTGKTVDKRHFAASTGCPETTKAFQSSTTTELVSDVDDATIEAWLKGHLARA